MTNGKSLKKNLVSAELIKNSERPIISDHIPIGVHIKFQQEL